jgi:PAS domain S-box-containing protein
VPPSDYADAARPRLDGLAPAPPQHRPRAAARAAVAVVASALAVALTVALAPVIPRATFVVAYAAVTVAAWYGGAWPGLLAGVLCVLGVDYYVLPPVGGIQPADPADYVPMAVFVGVAWLTGTLTDSLRRARDAVERTAGDLSTANQQLQEQAAQRAMQTEELQAAAAQLEERTREAEDARRHAEAERAVAQESERRFRATADTAPVLIWTSGLDALCDWFNQPWLAFTGRPMEAELGDGWAERVHPDDLDRCLAIYLGAFHAREPFAMEYRLQRHDGAYRWLLDNAVPRFGADGTFVGYIGTCVDVTDQRLAREAAEAARAAAEEANRAKSQFLSTMSHELRTPLNAVAGYVDLLVLGVRGPVTEAQRADLERLRRANQHLTGLVNDVLNFARLDAGQVEYHVAAVDLGPVVSDLETLIGAQLAAKGLAFDHDGCAADTPEHPHVVRADPDKLRQILLNLLTNALKFTDPGGRVGLACETDATAGVGRVRVTDSGRGIPPDQLSRIFEPFVQVDRHRTHESQQGVGLGLSISRELAQGMGGDLTAESTPGVGSTFTLTLPAVPAAA